MKCNTDQ